MTNEPKEALNLMVPADIKRALKARADQLGLSMRSAAILILRKELLP